MSNQDQGLSEKLHTVQLWLRLSVVILSLIAFVIIGLKEADPVKILLEIIVVVLFGMFLEVVLNALLVNRISKVLPMLGTTLNDIQGIKDELSKREKILPELRPLFQDMSKNYDECQSRPLKLFTELAKSELAYAQNTMRVLSNGTYRVVHQPSHIVDSSWEPMVRLATRGDVIIATSAVTPDWWIQNHDWTEANESLINIGVGIIRIFFYRTMTEYEKLVPTMRKQANIGVQVNVVPVDEVTKLGKKVRDIMLVKANVSDINNPINYGKQVSDAIALGEQHILANYEDWDSLTITDDHREIIEACSDLTAYLRASKRFEDDSWAEDFFDSDLHLIMQSKDVDASADVNGIQQLLKIIHDGKYIDLGAGYGRIAIPIAANNNATILAVEQSRELLDELIREVDRSANSLKSQGLYMQGNIIPKNCDIRQLLSEQDISLGSYDGAFSIFDSFGYYQSDAQNQQVIEAASKLLKPEGILILDLINPRQVHHREGSREWGKGVSSYGYWDKNRSRLLESYVIRNNVYKFKPLVSLRIYSVYEIKTNLTNAGFDSSTKNCYTYGKLASVCPIYDDHSPRLVVVAPKLK